MKFETRKERIILLGIIPIAAAVRGSAATVFFGGSSCQLGPGTDFMSVLQTSGMSGEEKMKVLELYRDVSDRPWSLMRSLVGILAVSCGMLVWALSERIRR